MSLWNRLTKFVRSSAKALPIHIVRQPIRGKFDVAQTTDDNCNHWAMADALDADSAHSVAVRRKAVYRSRYETANNGYLFGIVQTHANFVVGRGPKLRMRTKNQGFNAMVEAAWARWAKAVGLARKLRTQVKAKVTDGEGFLIARSNSGVRDSVKLDLVGIECEQCYSSDLRIAEKNRIDGIRFDDCGNPTFYDILPYHPGGQWWPVKAQAEQVPAKFVFHLFKQDRPGQHRAMPEMSSTLGLCAGSRRWREAVISAAESLAEMNLFIKTQANPGTGPGQLLPFDTLEMQKNMLTALPSGGDVFQPKAEQPVATHDTFLRTQISEQARPKSMAYTLASCDSHDSNFASAKLDYLPYYVEVDVEQADIEELDLEPIFDLWFEESVRVYGWAVPESPSPAHTWNWPARPQIDEEKTANARKTRLSCGDVSPEECAAEDGVDYEDRLQMLADNYGVSVEQMRAKLFESNFQKPSGGSPPQTSDGTTRRTQYEQTQPTTCKSSTDSGGSQSASYPRDGVQCGVG